MANLTPTGFQMPAAGSFNPLRYAPMAVLAVGLASAPMLGSEEGPVLCFSRRHTDVACPGCGLTRGVSGVVRGDFRASFEVHPLAIFLVAQAIFAVFIIAFAGEKLREKAKVKWLPAVLIIDMVALLGIWVVRALTGTLPPA